jgi:N-acetylglucosamine-6-phosphate deacetylase
MGHDSIEGSFDSIQSMALNLPSKGVTAFLPTTTAYFADKLSEIITVSNEFKRIEGAKPLGFHLEGPFLNKSEPGAMNPDLFEIPSVEKIEKLLESGIVRMMTVAPEVDNALDIIPLLSKRNVAVTLGHTVTSFEIAEKAFILGASSITHLFNAMPQFHHRSPGLIGAGFLYPFYVQFIADGVHTHIATIKIVCQLFKERLVLITDAIMAAGIEKPGVYKLGDFDIIVDETSARLSNGTLAGSILTMDKGFRNLIQFGNLSFSEAFKCASTNPALSINEPNRGVIKEGNYADFVVLRPHDLSVYLTIREGKVIYAAN